MKVLGRSAAISLGLLALAAASTPVAAEGIFERIFGGIRHAVEAPREPTSISSFADPFNNLGGAPQQRADTGGAKSFCVRSCDGHFFPVPAHAGMSAAESCNAFCPASKTRLYSGAGIDNAVASDGSRYADLANAFVYRKQLVAGCTCNGRDQFGLARMDVKNDPTLRPGDLVATKSGLAAYAGTKNNVADFTPINAYQGLSKTSRDKLADVRIMPPNPGAVEPVAATITRVSDRARSNDRAQAAR
jgi:Protein of unknown function (DUF2865)